MKCLLKASEICKNNLSSVPLKMIFLGNDAI